MIGNNDLESADEEQEMDKADDPSIREDYARQESGTILQSDTTESNSIPISKTPSSEDTSTGSGTKIVAALVLKFRGSLRGD